MRHCADQIESYVLVEAPVDKVVYGFVAYSSFRTLLEGLFEYGSNNRVKDRRSIIHKIRQTRRQLVNMTLVFNISMLSGGMGFWHSKDMLIQVEVFELLKGMDQ
jgi:hypothetical protein